MNSTNEDVPLIAQKIRERVVNEPNVFQLLVEEELAANLPEREESAGPISREVLQELTGFGVLQPFLDDPEIEEIWINGPQSVFVASQGVSRALSLSVTGADIRGLVERMLRHTGRRVDVSNPFVDASLPDGSRLHVVIPDITREHWSVNIRKFSTSLRELADLVQAEVLPLQAAHYLRSLVREGKSILISGATQAGKTTLLTALLAAVSD